mmetsp:Transcript_42094/g.61758  ORF Transcript_42094/g.61758 Transcript_42094/m.61758 type:complete len:270 (-) Transcript_42094:294-1103(-)|eukprot:CAMPEP_0195510116 /NCGR_PEP_ID=MMETSP0794_2-20130614/2864_1 /TAXON_ID=515487 /ORGANISM="Stephanopyxis turris, Strain CCMP 815" /LENGTH=269 /DNA_ID=CAMNT_0040637483 /DNA_START=95 /DNA_END=904 /DNA_ORIENTATION=-
METTTLVVGATGQTGKHVVAQLLKRKQNVHAVVRSKQRLFDALNQILDDTSYDAAKDDRLSVTEAAVLDMTNEEMASKVSKADAVVSCLGHTMSLKGMYGHPRTLVTDATKRLCNAIQVTERNSSNMDERKPPTKFILMGSDGVANPAGTDDKRSFSERAAISAIRAIIPPHSDNELAAKYLSKELAQKESKSIEWTVVRPTDLIDGDVTKYELFAKPKGSLFGGEKATRSNVARCMVDLVLNKELWEEWKFKMPVLYNNDPTKVAAEN